MVLSTIVVLRLTFMIAQERQENVKSRIVFACNSVKRNKRKNFQMVRKGNKLSLSLKDPNLNLHNLGEERTEEMNFKKNMNAPFCELE